MSQHWIGDHHRNEGNFGQNLECGLINEVVRDLFHGRRGHHEPPSCSSPEAIYFSNPYNQCQNPAYEYGQNYPVPQYQPNWNGENYPPYPQQNWTGESYRPYPPQNWTGEHYRPYPPQNWTGDNYRPYPQQNWNGDNSSPANHDGPNMPSEGPQPPWRHSEGQPFYGPNGSEYTLNDRRMTSMRDEAGRSFGFGYDNHTHQLNFVHNEDGDWDRAGGNNSKVWTNRQTGDKWTGDVTVGMIKDAHGHEQIGYSFDDGRTKHSYTIDGAKTVTQDNKSDDRDKMITTTTADASNGDGTNNAPGNDTVDGQVKYDVRNGVTVKAHLSLHGARLDSVGHLRMDGKAPIHAFEDGLCVYSSDDKSKPIQDLQPQDRQVVQDLESQGKNVVVVMNHTGRFDIYSDLGKADAHVNQFVNRSTVIGEADDSGVANFSVRRQRIGGHAVPVTCN